MVGRQRDRAVLQGIHYLMRYAPLGHQTSGFYYYGLYYATMGIYQGQNIGQAGRQAWRRWYPAVVRNLLATQAKNGSWSADTPPMYSTGVAVLLLNIPTRVLPVYQR